MHNSRQKPDRENRFIKRFLRFSFHFLSYFPSLLVVLIAIGANADPDKWKGFAAFCVATVSVEVCFTCLRERFLVVRWYGRHRDWNDPDKEETIRALLDGALTERGLCCVAVGIVIALWMAVTGCELARLLDHKVTSFHENAAIGCAGLTFGLSLVKMWKASYEVVANEALHDELAAARK